MNKMFEIALSQYGVKEEPGKDHNPIILKYFDEIGHSWVTNDETAWCSAFMNWCALKAKMEMSKKLNARSWLHTGIDVDTPRIGDIVVFWRENKSSWKGHVAMYVNETDDHINVIGGNQNNTVCIKPYPKYRLLQYRRVHNIIQG